MTSEVGPCLVVPLSRFRAARRAAEALVGLLHGPEWLVKATVEVQADGEPVVVALVATSAERVKMAFPRSIDHVEVIVRGVQPAGEGTA